MSFSTACNMNGMRPIDRPARERSRRRLKQTDRLKSRGSLDPGGGAPSSRLSLHDVSLAAPGALALRGLSKLNARYAPHDGVFPLRLPGTYALRRGRMTSEAVHATLGPSLCIVAQGAKVMMLGHEVLEYDPARMLVLAVDLPVSGQVTRASQKDPFLGFRAGPGSCARGRTRRSGLSTWRPQGLRQPWAVCRTGD